MVMTRTGPFTRADYMRLPEGYPVQLIEGALVREPAPTAWHQAVVLDLCELVRRLVPRRRVLFAPIDIFVDDRNVLQPDLLVLREADPVRCGDAEAALPLLVFEVLSRGTRERDRSVKTGIYLAAGVEEVWLVDPSERTVEVCSRAGTRGAGAGGRLASAALPGFVLAPDELFPS